MPGTTANGLPYPLPADLVMDGDDSIKALADAIEARGNGFYMQYGRTDLSVVNGDVRLTFTKKFAATPTDFQLTCSEVGDYMPLVGINHDGGGLTSSTCQLTVFAIRVGGTPTRWGGLLPTWWLAIGKGPLT